MEHVSDKKKNPTIFWVGKNQLELNFDSLPPESPKKKKIWPADSKIPISGAVFLSMYWFIVVSSVEQRQYYLKQLSNHKCLYHVSEIFISHDSI